MHRHITGAQLHLIEHCGQMSPREPPDQVTGILASVCRPATNFLYEKPDMQSVFETGLKQVALVGFGEAGSLLGNGLAAAGVKVGVYDILVQKDGGQALLQGRAQSPGIHICDSLAAALEGAQVVISAVTAASAGQAAEQAGELLRPGQVFVDINSVSPETKLADQRAVEKSGADYVESAVMAPVPPYGLKVPMLLGGKRAAELAPALVAVGMSAKAVADRVGVASAIKMCRSVVIKGLEAITTESLTAARRYGAEDAVLSSLAETFPSMGWTETLPDYLISRVAEHGRRRAEEMREVAQTLVDAGVAPRMSEASAAVQDGLVDAMQAAGIAYDKSGVFSWRDLADSLAQHRKAADK